MKLTFRRIWLLALLGSLTLFTGCTVEKSITPVKVVLFAPFEGRYREIGYEMLYAARLAFTEVGADPSQVKLIPVDDSGTLITAQQHAAAIALDPQVRLVITAGVIATHADVLTEFGDLPVIVVGSWHPTANQMDNIFRLTSADAAETPDITSDTAFVSY